MTPSEAARQYQNALEFERTLKLNLAGVISATHELARAAQETAAAEQQFIDVLVAHESKALEAL